MPTPSAVHYIPIATTFLSAAFLILLLFRASRRSWTPHLVWYAVGVFFFGLGTALEATITLFGNTPLLNRCWYWAGAIMGAYPLATGSVYLLVRRRLANKFTAVSMGVVVFASVMIFLTPIDSSALLPHKPSSNVIEWTWIRMITPFINVYALVFLVGGALWSTVQFVWFQGQTRKAIGTGLIAVGGLLPGIGGAMTKADLFGGKAVVEALYIGEFVGLCLIIAGYWICIRPPRALRNSDDRLDVADSGEN